MRILLLFLAALFAPAAQSAAFAELGVGYAISSDVSVGKSCLLDWKKSTQDWGCSSNPLGYAALGYEHKGFTFAVEHWSAIMEYDAGIDIVSIKYRWSFK